MATATAKKITLATLKSFIRKAGDDLQIRCESRFDGMTDCVQQTTGAKFVKAIRTETGHDNELGVKGVWVVKGSRDFFRSYEDDTRTGIKVSNCCGRFTVAVNK